MKFFDLNVYLKAEGKNQLESCKAITVLSQCWAMKSTVDTQKLEDIFDCIKHSEIRNSSSNFRVYCGY